MTLTKYGFRAQFNGHEHWISFKSRNSDRTVEESFEFYIYREKQDTVADALVQLHRRLQLVTESSVLEARQEVMS